jgi:hypothetical protein
VVVPSALAVALVLSVAGVGEVSLFDDLVAQGVEAQERGEHEAAVALFDRALLEQDDERVRALREVSRGALDAASAAAPAPEPGPREIVFEPDPAAAGGPEEGEGGPDPFLLIVGWSTFGATWLTCLGIGAGVRQKRSDRQVGDWLMVPVIGPLATIVLLSDSGVIAGEDDPLAYLLGWAFALQASGLAMGIIGALTFGEDPERAEAALQLQGFPLSRDVVLRAGAVPDAARLPAPLIGLGVRLP